MDRFSNLYGENSVYMEEMFAKYKQDPSQVSSEWRTFFDSLNAGFEMVGKDIMQVEASPSSGSANASLAQNAVSHMIAAYRSRGHKVAHTNPLQDNAPALGELSLDRFNLSDSMMDDMFVTDGILPSEQAKLSEITDALRKTYTSSIGVEYYAIPNDEERQWLKTKMESAHNTPAYDSADKTEILRGLLGAEKFENFLHTKYVGKKRFSGEGADALIPMLNTMIDKAGSFGVKDVVVGMAHRGRLSVLTNIFQKPYEEIFAAFDENIMLDDAESTSDVKYHFGKSSDITTRSGHKVHISLLNNPSHLEAVNPVVCGSARAKILRWGEGGEKKVLPLQIHGDAAFPGQGIVSETLNLANLDGYTVGGTIHVVINNQIGFTASPDDVFSGEYCTDVARILQAPVFHVNGEDAEACNYVMELATEYRNTFGKDVVIDLVCYRKYGHNEGDDPTFTSPVLYKNIKGRKTPYTLYKDQVLAEGSVSADTVSAMEAEIQGKLSEAYDKTRDTAIEYKADMFGGAWEAYQKGGVEDVTTSISKSLLNEISHCFTKYPSGFTPHPKLDKMMQKRGEMLSADGKMDWGAAEVAAYASLLDGGYGVRLSGQDVRRGTFSHRHVSLVDNVTGEHFFPIEKFKSKGAQLEVWNSALSELAVLGFEYGFSLAAPKTLTIWEAQFGDFSNGAQIVIDQFISSAEYKWDRMSGVMMSLPHGYEGQGPEHSSARPERYLQLCAQDNMTITNVTTPAQIFHLLRRQAMSTVKKPLVNFSPKSLLRHPMATSSVDALTDGGFQKVIDDVNVQPENVKKLVFCTGKLYYDLLARQVETDRADVAIVRIEQLYPMPYADVEAILAKYTGVEDIVWAQEEPRNQGFWTFIREHLEMKLPKPIRYVGRVASASPAVGSNKRHNKEQADIVARVFD